MEESGESKDESEEEEGHDEMACAGGCKGNWTRYSFEELDWNQDPYAKDGQRHLISLACFYRHYVLYSHCMFVFSGIVQCVQCRNWSHNECVARMATHNEGQLPDWTCSICEK